MFEQPYEDIVQELLDDVPNHLDKREGSIIFTALAPAAKKIYDLQIQLDRVLELTFASTSESDFLELRTAEMDVHRVKAVEAVREGIFNVRVPVGTRFYVNDLYYVTTEAGSTASMRCETPGEAGNIPVSGTDMLPASNVEGLETATMGRIITPGAEEQTDESLYATYVERISRPATSGNVYHYMQWAQEVTGVLRAKVIPTWDGPLTVKVILVANDGRAPSPELIQQTFDHIEEERPIGAEVTVSPAVEIGVDVTAEIQIQNTTSVEEVQNDFQEALAQEFRALAFQTETVRYARVAALLLEQPGVVDWGGLTINGLTSNIELSEEEIAVTGEVIFNEF